MRFLLFVCAKLLIFNSKRDADREWKSQVCVPDFKQLTEQKNAEVTSGNEFSEKVYINTFKIKNPVVKAECLFIKHI